MPFVVEVRDQYDDPFPGATVVFEVKEGGGSLSRTTENTNRDGLASVIFTTDPNPGANSVVASVDGIPQTQTFMVTYIKWDVNQDGKVEYDDLLEVNNLLEVSKAIGKPISEKPRADVNGDGTIDNNDVKAIGAYYTNVVLTHASAAAEDVNQDGWVDILDLVVVAGNIGTGRPHLYADVNDDGIVDVLDLVVIAGSPHWGRSVDSVQVEEPNATAPAVSVLLPTPETIREWITRAQVKSDGSLLFQRGIANLESFLASRIPSETRLLLNYPNPFNPETWIPYRLSEASDVTVSIYAVDGRLIRTLALGHQPAGLYQRKSRAAYWDGRNAFGEPVASGLYFYTLTAGDFTATRKMLIRQ